VEKRAQWAPRPATIPTHGPAAQRNQRSVAGPYELHRRRGADRHAAANTLTTAISPAPGLGEGDAPPMVVSAVVASVCAGLSMTTHTGGSHPGPRKFVAVSPSGRITAGASSAHCWKLKIGELAHCLLLPTRTPDTPAAAPTSIAAGGLPTRAPGRRAGWSSSMVPSQNGYAAVAPPATRPLAP